MMESMVEQMPQVKSEMPVVCGETNVNDFLGEVMDTGSRPSIQEIDSKQRMNLPSSSSCQFLIGGTIRTSPAFSVSDPSRLAPYRNCSSTSLHQHRGDPMLAAEQAGRRSAGSGRLYCKSGAAVIGGPAVSPEFHSTSGTPNSISQLLAAFSGSDNVALEFPSPLGSGLISPLNSAKLGRKRALSISPLSTGSLDLSNLIRSSPTSLLNYINASRGSSAGSIGHLSPSVFANPATPLRSHVLKHQQQQLQQQQQQQRPQQPANDCPDPIPVELDVSKLKLESVTASVDDAEFPGVYKDALKTLATVREEEGLGFEEDDGLTTGQTRTVECDSTTAGIEGGGGSGDAPDHKTRRRVYYNYPNTEAPHHNQCLWSGCSVQFGTLDELVRHVNVDHIYRDSKKDYVCCWEGCVRERKAFKAQYMLLVHMRRHTGEKPHQCTFEGCNKAYSRLENLKTHLRSHTGEKPYTCKYKDCDKSFSNASDCAKHMNRTHSDEKPYACPNPGCSKRYTDPSSRRKHVKNCQVNKKPKAEDAMSGADEESCTEGTGAQSIPPQAKSKAAVSLGKKLEKPNKKKKAESNHHTPRIGEAPTPMADHGYETGGSQGYVSSQTGHSSSGYDTEYPSLKEEELRHAVLPRPFDHVTSPIGHAPNPYLPMHRHVANKAMRPGGMGTDPKRVPLPYGGGPPGTYHPYPLQVDPLLSSCPPNDHQCVVHYTVPVGGPQNSRHPDQGPAYVTVSVQRRFGADVTSSGYSSMQSFSPIAKGDQRLPAEDPLLYGGGHAGAGFGLRNPAMTNSRSTFSSTSSRTSTPSSNNGRGEVKPLPPLSEGQVLPPPSPQLPTAPHGGQQHPWRQALRAEEGQYLKRSMDERSERSWRSYSSHSSRYSVSGSELSDELLESLPATGGLRNTFAKAPPLPLPESMQSRVPLPITSCAMDCGDALDNFPALSGDFLPVLNDVTLPLHHFGSDALCYDEQCMFSDGIPISQSQLLLANGLLSDTFAGDAGSNMVIGDMTSMAMALSCESRHYWEGMLQSAD